MAYQKQSWQTGETITAQKLNHIEDGISNNISSGNSDNILTVEVYFDDSDNKFKLNKTYRQIEEAFPNLRIIATKVEQGVYVNKTLFYDIYLTVFSEGGYDDDGIYKYCVHASTTGDPFIFVSETIDGEMIQFKDSDISDVQ